MALSGIVGVFRPSLPEPRPCASMILQPPPCSQRAAPLRRYFRSPRVRRAEARQQAAHAQWWEEFSSAIEAKARPRPELPAEPGVQE